MPSIALSSKRHLPLIRAFGREYYLGDPMLARDLVRYLRLRLLYIGADFSDGRWRLLIHEHELWSKLYLPKGHLNRDAVVLDAGAGEGETILFYSRHGFRNFIAMEVDANACDRLKRNTRHLNVALHMRKFRKEDLLLGADFAKIDVEGGEEELLSLDSEPPCEMILEIHNDQLLQRFKKKWPRMQVEYSFDPYLGTHAHIARLIL
jgi:hypothetical protein